MKKLLLILLCLPMIGFGQQTYVPDDNFEVLFESVGLGNGIPNDNYILTSAIDTITLLNIEYQSISDLTGIEDFTALTQLVCNNNQLTSLDVSNNTALTHLVCDHNQLTSLDVSNNTNLGALYCDYNQLTSLDVGNNTALVGLVCNNNQLTSLDVSNNTALTHLVFDYNQLTSLDVSNNTALYRLIFRSNQITSIDVGTNTALESFICSGNQLTSLDVSNNTALTDLKCSDNQLTSLDVSNNTALINVDCYFNQLTSLDVRNGNNTNMTLHTTDNPNLFCINVDDPTSVPSWWLSTTPPQCYFSNNCSETAIEEHTTSKELLKITDLLGRETKQTNQPLFYIYDDGTVEKRITID